MSSSVTSTNIVSVSAMKGKIQKILRNIGELEQLSANTGSVDVNKLQQNTLELLNQIERVPLKQFSKYIKKRKSCQQKKRLTHRVNIKRANACVATTNVAATAYHQQHNIKSLQNLRNFSYSQRILQTFELLKILNLIRSQDVIASHEFSTKFNNLCTNWNGVFRENTPQHTQASRIEDQWNQIFFGQNYRAYYNSISKTSIDELKQIRHIWDSYLTESKHGTSIPTGWVLPNISANSWQQYR